MSVRSRPVHEIGLALAAVALTAAGPPAPATLARLKSFVDAGYDPLTAPVDWHVQEPVRGAPRPLGPLPETPAWAADAAQWAETQGSTALLVSVGGQRIVERYWHGDGRDTRFNAQSMAKTVVALLVGIAIDKGEIKSVDDPLGRYLPAWQNDPRGAITLRQMLQMASGLAQIDGGKGYALTPDNPAVAQYFGGDYLTPALNLALAEKPGTRFDYNNNNVLILAHLLERVSKRRFPQLLSERLWVPLGLGHAAIGVDRPGGQALASANIFARPIDWLRIGELIAGEGAIEGKRIVSAAWISAMATPSATNKGYGFYLWTGDQAVGGTPLPPVLTPWQSEPFALKDLVLLNGFGGQRVWIVPLRKLVIVRAGRTWPSAWDDAKLPNLILASLPR